jgi:hypothetical protein
MDDYPTHGKKDICIGLVLFMIKCQSGQFAGEVAPKIPTPRHGSRILSIGAAETIPLVLHGPGIL